MIKNKRFKRSIAITIASVMLMTGCGLKADVPSTTESLDVVDSITTESSTDITTEADDTALGGNVSFDTTDDDYVTALRTKYAGTTKYTGEVYEVDRDKPIKVKIGYNPWGVDRKLDEDYSVYLDPALTMELKNISYDWDSETGVLSIVPSAIGPAALDDSDNVDLKGLKGSFLSSDMGTDWGNVGQYYLCQKVDFETGKDLAEPEISVVKVNSEIKQAPYVTFGQTDDGMAKISWDKVDDASEYIVCIVPRWYDSGYGNLKPIARVKDTEWICTSDDVDYGDEYIDNQIYMMNKYFDQFITSEDSEVGKKGLEEYGIDLDEIYKDIPDYVPEYDDYLCVIAVNKTGASIISNVMKAKDYGHLLPYERAYNINHNEVDSFCDSVLELPATTNIVMCDGTVSERVIDYDFDNAVFEDDKMVVNGTAYKTQFVDSYYVYGYDKNTLKEDEASIIDRQEKLKKKGGNIDKQIRIDEDIDDILDPNDNPTDGTTEEITTESTDEVTETTTEEVTTEEATTEETTTEETTTESVTESTEETTTDETTTEESTEEPTTEAVDDNNKPVNTDSNITANSALSEYIAKHMLEYATEVDLSAFPEATDKNVIIDACFEANYQNPLILGFAAAGYDSKTNTLYLKYDYDKATAQRMQSEIKSKVDSVTADIIKAGMSDYEKEEAINAYLCDTAQYDFDALKSAEANNYKDVDPKYNNSFNPYGILVEGNGVCAGYAGSFKLLADAAGLECAVVNGYLDGSVAHAWNKVKIDGQWNIIDTTNNDNEIIPNSLFNLSDSVSNTKLVQNEEFVIDSFVSSYVAPSDNMEYYRHNSKYYDKNSIVDQLASGLEASSTVILRTDYDITDSELSEIIQAVANKLQKNVKGIGMYGVIHIELDN